MVHTNWQKESVPKRFGALLRGEELDRVCVVPLMMGHCARVAGYPNLGDYYSKPEVTARVELMANEMYDMDQPILFLNYGNTCGEWGGEIEYPYRPKMGSIKFTKEPIQNPEDIEKYPIPDVKKGPYMEQWYQIMKLQAMSKNIPIAMIRAGCFSSACRVFPIAKLMLLALRQPDLVTKLFRKINEWGYALTEETVRRSGGDIIFWDTLPTDSNILVSPNIFSKFSKDSIIEFHEKTMKMGVSMWMTHWCGNHNANIKAGYVDLVPMGDPGIIHFGPETPISEVVQKFGNKNAIMGNIDPVAIFTQPYEKVLELAKKNIEEGMKAKKGYMVGCGCELPPPSPPTNVFALTKAAREYKK